MDAYSAAKAAAKQILEEYQPEQLSSDVADEIQAILRETERARGVSLTSRRHRQTPRGAGHRPKPRPAGRSAGRGSSLTVRSPPPRPSHRRRVQVGTAK